MKRILKIVTQRKGCLVSTLIVLALGVLAVYLTSIVISFPDSRVAATAAELESFQWAIQEFMVDNDLAEVTPSTSDAGGEIIRGTGSQFHATLDLQPYMRDAASYYCYRWHSDGEIIFQYDVNADGNCAIDADQLYP